MEIGKPCGNLSTERNLRGIQSKLTLMAALIKSRGKLALAIFLVIIKVNAYYTSSCQ